MKDERDRMRILLPAPKFCGRGVEYVELTMDEKERARDRGMRLFASEMGGGKVEDSDMVANKRYQVLVLQECVREMLRAVTVKGGYKSTEEIADPKCEWHHLDLDQLENSAEWGFKVLFGRRARDAEALASVYAHSHGFDQTEIDAIVGKALMVFGG
jgi:hypothetical protein